ncbi:Uncharacterised protein [Mycobacteroides abscessus subsp. massiliense]|nr:Uncharacterised protein [Mycobacteroides abscessus subsp. massiliense]
MNSTIGFDASGETGSGGAVIDPTVSNTSVIRSAHAEARGTMTASMVSIIIDMRICKK